MLWLGMFATAATAMYLLLSGLTFERGDALWFGVDARAVFVVTALIGLLAVGVRPLRLPWLIALTICTLGRSSTLIVSGSPTISSRVAELRTAAGWLLLWVLGSFPTLAMQASDIIRGRIEPKHEPSG